MPSTPNFNLGPDSDALTARPSGDSEAQLKSVLEDMGEAFYALDRNWRFLFASRAALHLWGKDQAEVHGKTLLEAFPGIEDSESYRAHVRVMLTRVPAHLQSISPVLHRWIELSLAPTPSGGIFVSMRDIHQRVLAEHALRESELRKAFQLKLSDALRPFSDPYEIQAAALRVLGEHLQVDRALYAEFSTDGSEYTIHHNYVAPGVLKRIGRFPTSAFANMIDWFVRAQSPAIHNIGQCTFLTLTDKQYAIAAQVHAIIGVPLIKEGRIVAQLSVQHSAPRHWTPFEIELVEDTAERTWAAIERARAESALRVSEAKYRTLFASIDEGFALIEVLFDEANKPYDYLFLETNPAFAKQTGLLDPVGKTVRQLLPLHEDFWIHTVGEIVRTGRSLRFEHEARALGGWFDVFGFPIGTPQERKVAVVFNNIAARKLSEQQLLQSEQALKSSLGETQAELRALSQHLFSTLDEQRRHIAQELHDSIGQRAVLINLHIAQLQRMAGDMSSEFVATLRQMREHVTTLAAETRQVARALHPPVITDLGLGFALQALVEEQHAAGVAVDLLVTDIVRPSVEVATALYRIAQEALSNAIRYAPGAFIQITLESAGGGIRLSICDEGEGFDLRAVSSGGTLGMVSIRQRAHAIGATLSIESQPGVGTTLTVTVPAKPPGAVGKEAPTES